MKRPIPKNDGWTDIVYEVGSDSVDNKRISALLNEACHVFYHHAEGVWREHDKDSYARKLVEEITKRQGLVGRLLDTEDRVIKMLTYRALELQKISEKRSLNAGIKP